MKKNRLLLIGLIISLIIHTLLAVYASTIPDAPIALQPKEKSIRVDLTKEKMKEDQLNKILKDDLKRLEELRKEEAARKLLESIEKPQVEEKKPEVKEVKKEPVKRKEPEKKAVQKAPTVKNLEKPKINEEIKTEVKPDKPPEAPKQALVLNNVSLNGEVEVEVGEKSNLDGDANVTVAQQKEMEKKVKDFDYRKGTQKEETVQVKDMGKPDIVPPMPINDVKGKYPDEMKDYNQVVIVILKLLISDTGEILDIKVVNAKNAYFEREARNAAKKLKFKPALKNGIPVSFPVIYKVKFLPEEA